jgi:hypothetical protein
MVLPLSAEAKEGKTSDGLLSSENLKEEKVRTAPVGSLSRGSFRRFVKDDSQQGTVYFQFTIVVNEAQLSESIHKEADTRARRAYHFGKGFLTDLGNYLLGPQ